MNDNKDITTNEVLNVKLDFMQKDIQTIKSDVKEIKADFITRREFDTGIQDLGIKTTTRFEVNETRLDKLYSLVYWIGGLLGTAFIGGLIKLLIVK